MARVLLIDDEPDQLAVRQLIFEHHGHAVRTAESAEAARTLFSDGAWDSIVMDLRLPELADGLELIRWFRAQAAFGGRIVVLCGYPKDLVGLPEESLVDAVLTKPARSDALLRLVDGA